MPLFEVDTQRPLLVTSANGVGGSEPGLKTTANQVVDSHIDGLLGEEVFPIAQGSGPDEPHLLALDASGSPVVVELVADLDRENLAKALDHAGAAGRLTRADLAARYSGGASSFQHDVAAFYDSVPITRTQAGKNGGTGARLIIICQNAPDEILNAVDFLRQPSMPVEVLKMGVVNSNDGRKFLDVSPLVVHLPPGLPAPKSAPIGGSITGSMGIGVTGGVAGGSAPPKDAFEEGVKVGYALTGKMPVVAQAPQSRSDRTPQAMQPRSERSAHQTAQSGRAASSPAPIADNPAPSGPTNAATGLRSGLRSGGTRGGASERSAGTRAARRAQEAAASSEGAAAAPAPARPGGVQSAPVSSVRPGAESRPTPATPPRLVPSRSSLGEVSAPPPPPAPAPAPAPAPSPRRRSRTDRFAASSQPDEPTSAYPPSNPTPSAGPTYPPPPAPQPQVEENLWQPTPSPYEDTSGYAGTTSGEQADFEITRPRYAPEPTYSQEAAFAPAAPSYGYPPEAPGGYGDQGGYGYGEQPGYEASYADAPAPVATEQNPWESGGYMAGPDDGYGQTAFAADPYPSSAPEAPARPVPPSESIRASTPMLFEEEDDPDLEALARSIGTPTRIVWSRPRRNQHFEAMLLPDGAIELANGARYRHPDSAATAASGSYTADGWSVWRLGDTGPTLVEEFSRRFA